MSMEDYPIGSENNDSSDQKISCEKYLTAVRTGVLRKKHMDTDRDAVMRTDLRRCLTTLDLIAYGVAAMLGGSIYVLTGTVANKRTGPAVFVAYIIAGFAALMNSMVYAEMTCRIPRAGSSYSYAYIILGELPAFLTGWSILLEYILSVATVARGWSNMFDSLLDGTISKWIINNIGRMSPPGGVFAEYPDIPGLILIVVTSAISCCGVRESAKVTCIFTVINVVVLVTITIYLFIYSNPENLIATPPVKGTTPPVQSVHDKFLPFGISGLIGGAAICFNAYIGFDAISTCAEEASSPNKSVPKANLFAVIIVVSVTSLATLSLVMYYPWYLLNVETPFLNVLRDNTKSGGPSNARLILFYFVGCGCLIGLLSSLLSNLVASPRVLYAMSQDGLLPSMCSIVSEPCKIPVVSTVFVTTLIGLLDFIFSVESLADFLSLGTLIAYSISSIGLITLRYCTPPEVVSEEYYKYRKRNAHKASDEKQLIDDTFKFEGPSGYLKPQFNRLLSHSTLEALNTGKPGFMVSVLLVIYIFLNICLACVLNITLQNHIWFIFKLILCSMAVIGMIVCIGFMGLYEQFPSYHPELFRLPVVPLFPCLTLTINIFLISQLTWITWARFVIWTMIGAILYFSYGVWNRYKMVTYMESTEQPQHSEKSPDF